MMEKSVCSVVECAGIVVARSLCSKHYQRWKKYNDPNVLIRAEDGSPQEFIEMALTYKNDKECLFWPYAKDRKGYAVGRTGGSHLVSRYICEKAHGPPPTTKHQAAHNCGKGHLGCVNPLHLRWDTQEGNEEDKIIHSTTTRGEQSGNAKLTKESVLEIRSLEGKFYQEEIAKRFNISRATVSDIMTRKRWAWL